MAAISAKNLKDENWDDGQRWDSYYLPQLQLNKEHERWKPEVGPSISN